MLLPLIQYYNANDIYTYNLKATPLCSSQEAALCRKVIQNKKRDAKLLGHLVWTKNSLIKLLFANRYPLPQTVLSISGS